jgi:hypothetical protein
LRHSTPLDTASQVRITLEAEVVLGLVAMCDAGEALFKDKSLEDIIKEIEEQRKSK